MMKGFKKVWYVYTMKYFSSIKRNKIVLFAKTWMDLKGIMLNKIDQIEKDKHRVILFTCGKLKEKKRKKRIQVYTRDFGSCLRWHLKL